MPIDAYNLVSLLAPGSSALFFIEAALRLASTLWDRTLMELCGCQPPAWGVLLGTGSVMQGRKAELCIFIMDMGACSAAASSSEKAPCSLS